MSVNASKHIVRNSIFRNGLLKLVHHIFLETGFQPIEDWSKALIRPNLLLGITKSIVMKFQISSLVTLYQIWLVNNKMVHKGI
jgi:hypothetical protein